MQERMLAHYRIIRKLGQGGMGEVYLAQDTRLDRPVALKVLPERMRCDPERLARFKIEAKAAAALNHPNIVTIYAVEEAREGSRLPSADKSLEEEDRSSPRNRLLFIVMEYVEGKRLSELIGLQGLGQDTFLHWFIPLSDALWHAHQRGVIHRDLKPDNILLSKEQIPKILDFGLARLRRPEAGQRGSQENLTKAGVVLGTLGYMSPEQATGKPVDARSDIYSFGLVMQQALAAGQPLGDHVSQPLRGIIAKCLAKDPDERYQTMLEVHRDLQLLANGIETKDRILARVLPSTYPHNLPQQLTPFIGREEEQVAIAERLADPVCRLLTLVGPGGIGKTRLALQTASEQMEAFVHGVYFIALAPVGSADLLVSTMANTLQFAFYGREEPRVQLINYLREKIVLLVLDNFEHLLAGADLLAEVLKQAPGVKMLVTSRERLSLQGEWVLEVEGLPFPGDEAPEQDEGYSAVRLFLESARRIDGRFMAGEEDRPSVHRICRLVDGMPLGIELAASWVRVLSCREIAEEIGKNLGFLTATGRDVLDRHRSLQAVFDHSWVLLSSEEQAVFRRMAVFRGGFRRDAAERVAGASLPVLLALVDKSLVRHGPTGRYEILEIIRQYAGAKLGEDAEDQETTHDRHGDYYASFLKEREGALKGAGQKGALEEIGEEIENVRAGWDWAIERGKVGAMGKALESLARFYDIRSWFREGEEAFARALEVLGKREEESTAHGQRDLIFGRLLARQGRFSHRLGRYQEARELLQRSLPILRDEGARGEIAFVLTTLGYVARVLGEYEEARQYHQRSLRISQEIGDDSGIARSLNNLGAVDFERGRYIEAKKSFQESLLLGQKTGDRREMAITLTNLGVVGHALGKYTEAKQCLQESLSLYQEIGDQYGKAIILLNLGLVAQAVHRYRKAKHRFRESLAIYQEIGHRNGIAISLINLGYVAYVMGEYAEAKEKIQEGLLISQESGDRYRQAEAFTRFGQVALALGDNQEAWQYFCEALKTAEAIGAIPQALEVLAGIAHLLTKEREKERAVEVLTLILSHPASIQEAKDGAAHLLSELESQLPPETIATARERGRQRKLDEVVAEILDSSLIMKMALPK